MKKITTLCLTFVLSLSLFSQWQNKSFSFDGSNRQYRVYVPANYNVSNPASIVMTLHGMGDNMTNFSSIGMHLIADTANIIVVVPQALSDQYAGTTWNSGAGYMGYYPNSGVDDVGFLNALLDTVQANYSINEDRIYCCGFSMGGFMTQRLGCELTNRFTAIASVSGTIGNGISSCNPSKVLPVAHFHGTADQTVTYANGDYGIGADSLIHLWLGVNNCSLSPAMVTFPDLMNDGYTIDHYTYADGDQGTAVELFKVNGADHIWLTNANDINYTIEIWNFFNRHQTATVGTKEIENTISISLFPNPATTEVELTNPSSIFDEYSIFTSSGTKITSENLPENNRISVEKLTKGVYFIQLTGQTGRSTIVKLLVN